MGNKMRFKRTHTQTCEFHNSYIFFKPSWYSGLVHGGGVEALSCEKKSFGFESKFGGL